ncbi:hypothetical protein [Desulfomonile tiedjei]|uniref:Uncharacterized protein n=1 Tax=Desulfomonile tiedjei (strain ATCC 49306 / DSM 6799 / DCB-1) TaxID=706587 RepID=I4C366_DESTA|nr:hypothetical protein [Desulfomonile tiedjei]AFM24007.1 hypothetical protein Desti_1294 [Desulfomonile tiedjei DSM 6799]
MIQMRHFMREFTAAFLAGFAIIIGLTMLAGFAASHVSPETVSLLKSWSEQNPAQRFDDWMDGIVVANILYSAMCPRHSLWTYFLPANAPPAGFDLLKHVLTPQNNQALVKALETRQGELLHRYWTGHIVLTAIALYVYIDPAIASKAAMGAVLLSFFFFAFVWTKRLSTMGGLVFGLLLLGSGVIYMESFHTHTWGLAVAGLTAAYTGLRLERGKSFVAPAVLGGIFANWVGYDYVFPTLAFSLLFFLQREERELRIHDMAAPFKFAVLFLAITALMMVLRVPIAYLFEQVDPSLFVGQLTDRLAYRLQGDILPQELASGMELTRSSAILSALPAVDAYLFNLGGRFMPLPQSLTGYAAFQMLPIVILSGILIMRNRSDQLKALRPVAIVAVSALLFHLLLLVLVNHACVHPWMHARYMVFSMVVSSAVAAGAAWDVIAKHISQEKI